MIFDWFTWEIDTTKQKIMLKQKPIGNLKELIVLFTDVERCGNLILRLVVEQH